MEPSQAEAPATATADPERVIEFFDGLLGMTLKRSAAGLIVVREINPATQAASNGVLVGDVVRECNGLDLRGKSLDKAGWQGFIDHLKASARPLRFTMSQGTPAEVAEKPKKTKKQPPPTPATSEAAAPPAAVPAAEDTTTSPPLPPPPQAESSAARTPPPMPPRKPSSPATAPAPAAAAGTGGEPTAAASAPEATSPPPPPPPPQWEVDACDDLQALEGLLDWPAKGPPRMQLTVQPGEAAGGARTQRRKLRLAGPLQQYTKVGWFGNPLVDRFVFLTDDVVLVTTAVPTKLSKKGSSSSSSRRSWSVGSPQGSAGSAMAGGDGGGSEAVASTRRAVTSGLRFEVEAVVELPMCRVRDVPANPPNGFRPEDDGVDEVLMLELLHPGGSLLLTASTGFERRTWVSQVCVACQDLHSQGKMGPRLDPVGWYHGSLRSGNIFSAAWAGDLPGLACALGVAELPPDGRIPVVMAPVDSIHARDVFGNTALHLAAASGAPQAHEAVTMLLDIGADASMMNADGQLALHGAARRLDDLTISALVSAEAAAVIDHADPTSQRTALYTALVEGYQGNTEQLIPLGRCVTALKVWGASPNAVDRHGLSACHRLAARLHARALDVLLRTGGVDVNAPLPTHGLAQWTANGARGGGASAHGTEAASSATTDGTAGPTDDSPTTPAGRAGGASGGAGVPQAPPTAEELIAKGAGATALHLACASHLLPRALAEDCGPEDELRSRQCTLSATVRSLLAHGADPNLPTPAGFTPLHLLMRRRGLCTADVAAAAVLLLAAGALPDTPDPDGNTVAGSLADGLDRTFGGDAMGARPPCVCFPANPPVGDGPGGAGAAAEGASRAERAGASAGLRAVLAQQTPQVVVGQLQLVTRGKLAFFGAADRERVCSFLVLPGGFRGRQGGDAVVFGLRVKKDELRLAAVGRVSEVDEVDATAEPTDTKSNGRTRKSFPISVKLAQVEGQDGQTLTVHAASASDRMVWARALAAALRPRHLKSDDRAVPAAGPAGAGARRRKEEDEEQQRRELMGEHYGKGTVSGAAGAGNAAAVSASAQDTVGVMSEMTDAMKQRGEALSKLSEKTEQLENASEEFERMCRELANQQNRGGGWF